MLSCGRALILNSLCVVKSCPYIMRYTNNFVEIICKSNIYSLQGFHYLLLNSYERVQYVSVMFVLEL